MNRGESISAFFPCYNDKGTIATIVAESQAVLEKLTDDFEIIVVDDGSTDGSRELLQELQHTYPKLKLVFHDSNRGYGSALRSGIAAATKELIFYTDGDGQYDVKELPRLFDKLSPDIDVVNGYKLKRNDPWYRIVIGLIYQYTTKVVFGLKIKDVDCDYRLMRRKIFDKVHLLSDSGTICVEMVRKIQDAGFKFAEVGVSHHHRTYGKSRFFTIKRISVALWRLFLLRIELLKH